MSVIRSYVTRRRTNAALAVVAAALLVAGVTWHGAVAAEQPGRAATVSTPITHAIAGGRDSYADVVEVISPAVVTIRVSGKARVSPTQFQGPDDDLLRRFFGEQFGERGQRQAPRTFRERGPGSGVVVTTDGY